MFKDATDEVITYYILFHLELLAAMIINDVT